MTSQGEESIWTQRDHETPTQYHAFGHYRDLGPLRSIQRAYEDHLADCDGQVKGRIKAATTAVPRRWYTWSSDNMWVVRVASFDRYLDADKLRIAMVRMEAIKEFHWNLGRELLNFAAKVLNGMDPERFPQHLLKSLIEIGITTMDRSMKTSAALMEANPLQPPELPAPAHDFDEVWTDAQVEEALDYARTTGVFAEITEQLESSSADDPDAESPP